MGREIRRVPANWEHTRQDCPHSPWSGGCDEAKQHGGKCYHPMYDQDFESAMDEWIEEYQQWKRGEHPDWADGKLKDTAFWEWWGDPPQSEYYHPKWDTAEWYQVYETVSEGTPLTPPFATKAELVDYLVEHGDFWDQKRGSGGWTRENAERFVENEWAPSMEARRTGDLIEIKEPRDGSFE